MSTMQGLLGEVVIVIILQTPLSGREIEKSASWIALIWIPDYFILLPFLFLKLSSQLRCYSLLGGFFFSFP